MARRKRRRRHSPSKANPRSYGELRARMEPEQGQAAAAQTRPAQDNLDTPSPSSTGQTGKKEADWKVEYGRVFSDLKQLLIVSVALFALMLVVGLFL